MPEQNVVGLLARIEELSESALRVQLEACLRAAALGLDNNDGKRYYRFVIRFFKTKETESIWIGIPAKHFSTEMQVRVRRKLRMLNNVRTLQELQVPPGNRLEQLRSDRRGQLSILINDQFRICFSWREGDCFDVELADYH